MKNLLPFLLFLCTQAIGQPQPIMVMGKVVEVTDEGPVGLPNVTVRVPGESEDVTKTDGSFILYLPPDQESIFISLENCPHPMVSPYAGRVNIPPSGFLNIKVCAAENKKLRAKIDGLNTKIQKLERQRLLSKRQLAEMHQTLLDTILHFETQINLLNEEVADQGGQLAEKQGRVNELEQKVAVLEDRLFLALEEKYQRQKAVFDEVSASLEQYVDQAKNLRDAFRPTQIRSYFSTAAARERLYGSIEKYNDARKAILDNRENLVAGVANYWEAYQLADELEETFDYLLQEVHEEGVYPMEFAVNDNLKQALTRQLSNSKARKAAMAGAEDAIPNLSPKITELENKTEQIVSKLRNNL